MAGVRTAVEKMLFEFDAVLRHEGEEVDAIVVVGEVGSRVNTRGL